MSKARRRSRPRSGTRRGRPARREGALRVGVIGGSYAGCSFARRLALAAEEEGTETRIEVTVLELRSERELCSTPGSLNVYGGAGIFEELRLGGGGEEAMRAFDDGTGKGRTSKQKLLSALVDSLPRGTMHFEMCADRVHLADGKIVVACTHQEFGGSTSEYEFDALVGADGLTSRSRGLVKDNLVPLFLIGDASRQFGRELCFGLARSRYGASQGMRDSIRLAKAMLRVVARGEGLRTDHPELSQYTMTSWRRRMRQNAVFLFVMAASLLFCLVHAGAAR